MDRRTFLLATLIAHVTFAVGVAGHAKATGRDAGRWAILTLVFGIAGVAGYVSSDDSSGV